MQITFSESSDNQHYLPIILEMITEVKVCVNSLKQNEVLLKVA